VLAGRWGLGLWQDSTRHSACRRGTKSSVPALNRVATKEGRPLRTSSGGASGGRGEVAVFRSCPATMRSRPIPKRRNPRLAGVSWEAL
jgi:hypothetical protein